MILSQITRSDVRFELLLSTSAGENLSPEVSPVAQTVVSSVSQTVVAVVGPGTIAVVAVVGISIGSGLSSSGGLSISGPLAVVETMVRVSVSGISTVETRVGVWVVGAIGAIEEGRISLGSGLGLSISRPLSVVQAMVSIRVSIAIGSVASIGVRIGAITIGEVRVSLSLRLGLWLTGDEGGKANHKSELHCYL